VGLGSAVFLTARPAGRLSAQVGYDPSHSPFRDVRRGVGVRFATGYLSGGRGTVPVGLSGGPTFGVRFETSLSRVVAFTAGVAYGQTTRFIVFPYDSAAKRTKGPFDSHVVLTDLGLQLSLTGAKTFHGLLPYVGASTGLAFGRDLRADTSGYRFGSKLTIAPGVGVRWYPARRVSVQADTRALFWKLNYPITYKDLAADGSRVLKVTATQSEWTTHSWISLGVGWTF
jgi:hypothetical protein